MNREFTVELDEEQANFLNQILPKNYSCQIFERYERRKKAQKKLDDMYVAQFSLRPVKKTKIQNQSSNQRFSKQNNQDQKQNLRETLVKVNYEKDQNNMRSDNSNKNLEIKGNNLRKENDNQKVQTQQKAEIQQPSIRQNRSQRVSKPTQAYIQFQQEAFKRKIVQKQQLKAPNPTLNRVEETQKKTKSSERIIQQPKKQSKQKIDMQMQIEEQKPEQKQVPKKKPYSLRRDPQKKQHFEDIKVQKVQKIPVEENFLQNQLYQSINPSNKLKGKYYLKQLEQNKQRRQHLPHNLIPRIKQIETQQPSMTRCWRILQRLKINKSSWPFRRPVDPVAQGVLDYLQVVKHPMDLKTIQKKLRAQKYGSEQQFYADVELMFQNSYLYNPSSSKYHKLTKQVQKMFIDLKSKKEIPKHTARNTENDEQQDEYDSLEEEQEEKCEENIEQDKQADENQKLSPNSKRKAAATQLDLQLKEKAPVKIISSNQGPVKIEKQTKNNQVQIKIPQKIQTQQVIEPPRRRVIQLSRKIVQIEPKQIPKQIPKSAKKQSLNLSNKKKSLQENKKQVEQKIQVQKVDKNIVGQFNQKLRFGYSESKPSIIQRQTLLYDILHLRNVGQVELQDFIFDNRQKFNKSIVAGENQQKLKTKIEQQDLKEKSQQKQKNKQNLQNPDQQEDSFELQLKDLDMNGFVLLRKEVNKLMKNEEINKVNMIKEEIHLQRINESMQNEQILK